MIGPAIFGALGKFLGKLLFGNSKPTNQPRQPQQPPKKQQLEIRPPSPEDRALTPATPAAQKSQSSEYNRLYGILKTELAGMKNNYQRDSQRRRRRGKQLPPETTRQDPRPYGKRDVERHGDLSLRYGYQDGQDVDVDSSWIGAFNFRLYGGDYGGEQDIRDVGDLTMVVLKPSWRNMSGRYVYPSVPRAVMNRAMMAPSKGKFYWAVLRFYSNRGAIGRRMMRTAQHLINNPNSPHAGPRRGRR
jgi:hypothetical protein